MSRVPNPEDRPAVEALLVEADKRLGGADGMTSEIETRDYLVRDPSILLMDVRPAELALQVLGAVTPPAETNPRGRTFLEMRSALARITHGLRNLQSSTDTMPSNAEAASVARLEAELRETVYAARELGEDPRFATILAHANAATIRVGAFRAWGIFADASFATPALFDFSPASMVASSRIELAAVRAAADHISGTAYTVVQGNHPEQVARLVNTLHGIRDNIVTLRPPAGQPIPADVAALMGDFNETLRIVAGTTYSQRTRNTTVTIERVSDLRLPERLVP